MKEKMMYTSIILGLFLLQMTAHCQTRSTLDFSFNSYSYLIGEESVHICEIVIQNSSDNEYVFWFDTANVVGYSTKRKIHSYFHRVRGDFSLYNLMTENLLTHTSPILFGSFLKKMKRKEKFVMRVIGGESVKDKSQRFIAEHFVAIKKEDLMNDLRLGDEFFSWYDRQSIDTKEEFLP
jgi:hypothetical protein